MDRRRQQRPGRPEPAKDETAEERRRREEIARAHDTERKKKNDGADGAAGIGALIRGRKT